MPSGLFNLSDVAAAPPLPATVMPTVCQRNDDAFAKIWNKTFLFYFPIQCKTTFTCCIIQCWGLGRNKKKVNANYQCW